MSESCITWEKIPESRKGKSYYGFKVVHEGHKFIGVTAGGGPYFKGLYIRHVLLGVNIKDRLGCQKVFGSFS